MAVVYLSYAFLCFKFGVFFLSLRFCDMKNKFTVILVNACFVHFIWSGHVHNPIILLDSLFGIDS